MAIGHKIAHRLHTQHTLKHVQDRRVPLDDGQRYIDAVRAAGVPTRVLVFPNDTHALDKVQTEFEQWLNLAWWLGQHVPKAGGGEPAAT